MPLLLMLAFVAAGAEKHRDWQTGKVLDTNRSRYFLIEGPTYTYLVRQRLGGKSSKPVNRPPQGQVKFAVEKRKVFVMEEDGQEFQTEVLSVIRLGCFRFQNAGRD